MVVLTGIAAGLLGALMMLILFNVQYAAFGYHEGSLQQGVEQASAARRVGSLLVAGVFGGVAWFLLRRYTKGEPSEIDEALWSGDGRLSFRRCLCAAMFPQKFSPATTFTTPGVTGARRVPQPASTAAAASSPATSRRATPAHLRSGTAVPCPAGKAGRNRRSRRLLVTTNTELNAIAAAAISGLRNPRAASGMAAVL